MFEAAKDFGIGLGAERIDVNAEKKRAVLAVFQIENALRRAVDVLKLAKLDPLSDFIAAHPQLPEVVVHLPKHGTAGCEPIPPRRGLHLRVARGAPARLSVANTQGWRTLERHRRRQVGHVWLLCSGSRLHETKSRVGREKHRRGPR